MRLQNVSVRYRDRPRRSGVLALDGITLSIERGEKVGVIGSNGAGKSTLMRVMAGILRPDAGRCDLEGMSATLLSLNAGFDPELSGRRNIVTHGMLMGLAKRQAEARVAAVAEASGLGDAIERRVATYSNGMRARLCFWAAIDLQPDLMLVDEVLAVGDKEFRDKSQQALLDLMQGAGAVVLVSHNLRFVTDLCERLVWLDGGRVRLDGDSPTVAAAYEAATAPPAKIAQNRAGCNAPAEVFVCGVPGGAASTVAQLLNAHPQAVLGTERYAADFHAGTVETEDLWSKERFFGSGPVETAATAKFEAASVVGDKIDTLHRHFEALNAALPHSKVVFVLRDPLFAVWARADNQRHREEATGAQLQALFGEHLAAWEEAVAAAMAAGKPFGPRLLVLSQDRLFGRQRYAVLAGLFRSLDLPVVMGAEAKALLAEAIAEDRAERTIPPKARKWIERRANLRRYGRLLYRAL